MPAVYSRGSLAPLRQGPIFPEQDLHDPDSPMSTVDLLQVHLHDLLPHGFGFNLWLIGRLERQCAKLLPRQKDRKPFFNVEHNK